MSRMNTQYKKLKKKICIYVITLLTTLALLTNSVSSSERNILPADRQDHLIEMPEHSKASVRNFYKEAIQRLTYNTKKENINFIVVCHTVPTIPFMLEGLEKLGNISAIILKGSQADPNIYQWIKHNYRDTVVDKHYLQRIGVTDQCTTNIKDCLSTKGTVTKIISYTSRHNKKSVIIDIGGYFAPALQEMMQPELRKSVLGIVEDTENGQQKYEKAVKNGYTIKDGKYVQSSRSLHKCSNSIKIPIISVARSEIKRSEDYNVGKAIVDATDHVLRVSGYTHIAEAKNILIIGYGKVGSAAARVVSEKTRGKILVCDTEPIRSLLASAHSFKTVTIEEGLKKADVIICCTGNKCLSDYHLKIMKNNAYIASCTSADDEFDLPFLWPKDARYEMPKYIDKNGYVAQHIKYGKKLYFLRNGNSINFVEKAVHGYFIHGVLSSLVVAASQLVEEKICPEQITHFDEDKQALISKILMKYNSSTKPILKFGIEDGIYPESKDEHSFIAMLKDTLKRQNSVVVDINDFALKGSHMFANLYQGSYKVLVYVDMSNRNNATKLAKIINTKIKVGQLSGEKIKDISIEGIARNLVASPENSILIVKTSTKEQANALQEIYNSKDLGSMSNLIVMK